MRAPTFAYAAALFSLMTPLLAASPQNTPAPATLRALAVAVSKLTSCPVGFAARRQSPTEVVAIDHDARHRSGQGVHLSLQHPDTDIRSAEVVVHAASNKTRYLPLQAGDIRPDLSKDFHLSASGAGGLRSSDLWLDNAGSITSVDLVSITYADGTTWNPDPSAICRAIPNGFMPVDLTSSR